MANGATRSAVSAVTLEGIFAFDPRHLLALLRPVVDWAPVIFVSRNLAEIALRRGATGCSREKQVEAKLCRLTVSWHKPGTNSHKNAGPGAASSCRSYGHTICALCRAGLANPRYQIHRCWLRGLTGFVWLLSSRPAAIRLAPPKWRAIRVRLSTQLSRRGTSVHESWGELHFYDFISRFYLRILRRLHRAVCLVWSNARENPKPICGWCAALCCSTFWVSSLIAQLSHIE